MSINQYKPMLLLTVNNSIGDKTKHYTLKNLLTLFTKNSQNFTELDKYIIETIQTEASAQEINTFKKLFQIDSSNINYLLSCKPY